MLNISTILLLTCKKSYINDVQNSKSRSFKKKHGYSLNSTQPLFTYKKCKQNKI